MQKELTIGEIGREKAEEALVETALAFHYHNPYCQYNVEERLTENQDKMVSQETSPERACREEMHYEDCRGLVADIYWNAIHMIIPGTRLFWHPVTTEQFGLESLVMQYGAEDGIKPYRDYEKFVEDFFKNIRPGDILMSDKADGNSHIMIYLGKCMGDGKRYIVHDWPVGGGNMKTDTGRNVYEPNGSAILETVEDLWYPGVGNPHWEFGVMAKFWLFRPLKRQCVSNTVLPAPTASRLKYPRLVNFRFADKKVYDTVLKDDILTITETVENKGKKAYKDLTVTEYLPKGTVAFVKESQRVNGKKAGVEKVVDNCPALQFVIDVPAGEKVTMTYKVKVTTTKKDKITIPCGKVDEIPSRELTFVVGEARLAKEEFAAMKALKKGKLPEALIPKTFRDLDYVNLFYKNVLGRKTVLPKTVNELLTETFYVNRHPKIFEMAEYAEMLDLRDDEHITERGKKLKKTFINRFVGGWYVFLETRNDRAFDYLEEYFEPGDCFIVAGGKNKTSITDKENLTVYVYVGNGTVIRHKKSGTTRENFEETVGRAILQNIVIGLRPANVLL